MRDLVNVSILDLIPPNIRNDPQVIAAAQAIDSEMRGVTQAVNECIFFYRVDELPEAILDHLAWQCHIDFYSPDLALEKKRSLIKESPGLHLTKGTPAAVEDIVSIVISGGQVQEWWEYGGDPYCFRVIVEGLMDDEIVYRHALPSIMAVKNARSKLDGINYFLHGGIQEQINNKMQVTVQASIRPWSGRLRWLDGSWRLDGSEPLDDIRYGPRDLSIILNSSAINANLQAMYQVLNSEVINPKVMSLASVQTATVQASNALLLPEIFIHQAHQTAHEISAQSITIFDPWFLDGTYALDGEKVLDALWTIETL